MEGILYKLKTKVENFFKIFTFPKKMPKDIFKSSKISIGFDPKLFTKKTLSIFFKGKYKLKPLRKNFVDEIWKRKKKLIDQNSTICQKILLV